MKKIFNRLMNVEKNGCLFRLNQKKILSDKLFIQHEITYRIYRNWEDFEEYNLKNIGKLKTKISEASHGTF